MKWHYKTDPDFKWPKEGEEVLIASVRGHITVLNFHMRLNIELIEAWADIEKPKKKRWKPELEEKYWAILGRGYIREDIWGGYNVDSSARESLGLYKTKEEAEAMFQKIKDFVTKEIGEV